MTGRSEMRPDTFRLDLRMPHSTRGRMNRDRAWETIRRSLRKWYVYMMWRCDGAAPIPFYVGKGRGYRAMHHELPCTGGSNLHKQRIIDLHRAGGLPLGYTLSFYA